MCLRPPRLVTSPVSKKPSHFNIFSNIKWEKTGQKVKIEITEGETMDSLYQQLIDAMKKIRGPKATSKEKE